MNLLIRNALFNPIKNFLLTQIISPFTVLKAKPKKKPVITFKRWTIVRGDIVKIIAGKDKNKVGKVTRVWRKQNKITVRGVNLKIKRVSNLFVYFRKSLRSYCSKKKTVSHTCIECGIV